MLTTLQNIKKHINIITTGDLCFLSLRSGSRSLHALHLTHPSLCRCRGPPPPHCSHRHGDGGSHWQNGSCQQRAGGNGPAHQQQEQGQCRSVASLFTSYLCEITRDPSPPCDPCRLPSERRSCPQSCFSVCTSRKETHRRTSTAWPTPSSTPSEMTACWRLSQSKKRFTSVSSS